MHKNKIFLLCLVGVGFTLTGCQKEVVKPDVKSALLDNDIVGNWFGCEFGSKYNTNTSTDKDCLIVDDDGFQFSKNGNLYKLEERTQNREWQCGRSPCFKLDRESISARKKKIGSYSYSDGVLNVVTNKCSDSSSVYLLNDKAVFESGCLNIDNHARKYNGIINY